MSQSTDRGSDRGPVSDGRGSFELVIEGRGEPCLLSDRTMRFIQLCTPTLSSVALHLPFS